MGKKEVISGVFWKFSERMAAQLVSLVVSVVLARLLAPSDYGAIALVTVFITIANVFVSSGFATALIQKHNSDSCDFSTVFYFGIAFSLLLYVLIWPLAILVADFYEIPELKPVLRVLALSIPVSAVNSVQQAYVSKKMIFRKFFFSTLIGTIISAIVGIWMAYNNFGIWALVWQNNVNVIAGTIALWLTIEWRPTLEFSFERLKGLFSYGWKILLQSLVVTVYGNIRSLLIGKIYTTEDLAYYTKGSQYPNLVATNIDTAMSSALFPAMSNEQRNPERVVAMTTRTSQLCSYIMSPLLIGLAVTATNFITILLTEKWILAVPYLQIMCVSLLFRPSQTAILQAIKAMGRSDIVLIYDTSVRVIGLVIIVISIRFGVLFLAISEVIITVIGLIIYAIGCKKVIDYGVKEVICDCGGNICSAILMGVIIYIVSQWLNCNIYLQFVIQLAIGVIAYILISIVSKNKSWLYIIAEFHKVTNNVRNKKDKVS